MTSSTLQQHHHHRRHRVHNSNTSSSSRPKWDESIPVPPILRPLVRAYILGYASSVGPRIITLVLQHVARQHVRRTRQQQQQQQQRKRGDSNPKPNIIQPPPPPREPFVQSLLRILRCGFDLRRFPAFCAALIGGTTLLECILLRYLPRLLSQLSEATLQRISRWFASFIAAWFSLQLLQSKHYESYSETTTTEPDSPSGPTEKKVTRYAGRTLDLTLFAACRAIDVVVGELWAQRRKRRTAANTWTRFETTISHLTDPTIFATSSALIMWAWFYHPTKLPRSYHKWISTAASVDARLITALQRCRRHELRYGEEEGKGEEGTAGHAPPLLQSMCADYGWPLQWGDPAKAIPFPCEMVHMGTGPSCEYHALSRFARSFKWAMATYLPLNLLILTKRRDVRAVLIAVRNAARSSAFLGAFIALFYYGVCLARTRVGPRALGAGGVHNKKDPKEEARIRQHIDSGVCVGAGCFLCGWSILIEKPGRVMNIALFVAPRALATLLPRRYPRHEQWRETLAFAVSTAVVLTCVRENPGRVRGVLGKVLKMVLEP